MEGGFGPWGKPRPPERERRPDRPGRDRDDRPSQLRLRGERRGTAGSTTRAERATKAPARAPRRRRRPPGDIETEILGLGGRRGPFLLDRLMAAADAFGHDRDREALTLLRPVRDALPDAPSVRELCGLSQYRLGNYRAAAKELEAYVELTDAVDQHPVLMDCYRAQRRWRKVDQLWADLGAASPSSELMIEGRIVAAGALADRGRLDDAIAVLDRKAGDVKRARPHHLRVWYALGDLEERAGNLARARVLFDRVRAHDPEFADVTARRAALA
jgi:tetratricopeptide (TPR) repeat protein